MMLTKWVVGNIILKPTMAIVLFILGILKLERCFMMQRGTGVNVLKMLLCVLQLRLRFLRGPCCKHILFYNHLLYNQLSSFHNILADNSQFVSHFSFWFVRI